MEGRSSSMLFYQGLNFVTKVKIPVRIKEEWEDNATGVTFYQKT